MAHDKSGSQSQGLSYRDAGVDIDAGDRLVEMIKPFAAATRRPGLLAGIGGFSALFEVPLDRYRHPVLVSGTDGVGTKLRLAIQLNQHDTVGIDLVAMCANDLVVTGAEPLFFLDYYATGKLDPDAAARVIRGIAEGCRLAGAALSGGETAEMPGMYHGDDYDLAGFCVGVVEKDRIIDGQRVCPGDALIGIASSGCHSNGYSLVRKIIEVSAADLYAPFDGRSLSEVLLEPTRIYVKAILGLASRVDVRAVAHITGGGIPGNLPRVLPDNTHARIESSAWRWPAVFNWLQETGRVSTQEMYRTFNCGIGMIICVPQHDVSETLVCLAEHGEDACVLGAVHAGDNSGEYVVIS